MIDHLRRLVMNWQSRSRVADTLAVVSNVRKNLSGFSHSAEQVFLPVGERLMGLQSRAHDIAAQTMLNTQLMSSDEGSLAVLDEVLQAARGTTQEGDVLVNVQTLQQNAKTIHQAIDAIHPIVNTFDVLGVMTRIESSRFETAGASFAGLADAVTSLSRQIREQIGITAGSATELFATACQAAEQVRREVEAQRQNLGPLTRQSSAGLLKMKDHRGRISQANTLLGTRFEGISAAIGDLVTDLQSHDIVRQQIEHVLEALDRLDSSTCRDAGVFEVARLQAAQIDNSRKTFAKSVRGIGGALSRIELNIAAVAEESARLLGSSDAGETSFLTGLKSDLAGIVAILDRNASADRRVQEAAASVRERITGISKTIAGISAIGIQMQRIALNATIQAAELGSDGGALERVAQAIQELARLSGAASGTIENHLSDIRDAAMALEQSTSARSVPEAQLERLRLSVNELDSDQDKAQSGYARTIGLIAGIRQQIRESIAGFGDQDESLDMLATATQTLRDLSNSARPRGSGGATEIAAVYTMQSERAVHQALYDTVRETRDPAPLEDNVEFF